MFDMKKIKDKLIDYIIDRANELIDDEFDPSVLIDDEDIMSAIHNKILEDIDTNELIEYTINNLLM